MPGDLTKWFEEAMDNAYEELDEFVEETLDTAWNAMAEMISTRGAKREWHNLPRWHALQDAAGKPRRDGSHPGRVHTGHMLDSLGTTRTPNKQARTTSGEVGWVQGWEEYFREQEQGFINPETDEPVEGMDMLVTTDEILNAIGQEWERS